jgi:hypothetical protein
LRVDEQEENNLTPHKVLHALGNDLVLVAKPSPHPSSNNFGGPSDVPNKSGLFFPYFQGMMVPDAKGLRDLVSALCFRNLGGPGRDCRDAYKEIRTLISSVASTPQGIIMQHVLKGIHLALEAQAILFLVFVDGAYSGFCLLGEKFSVFANGAWHDPQSAADLKDDLRKIQSRQGRLESLGSLLVKCKTLSGDAVMVDQDRLSEYPYLANLLANLELGDKETSPEDEIAELLGHTLTITDYKTFKPRNIVESLTALSQKDFLVPIDVPFFIPLRNWRGIDRREYQILAAYGPRSFSLRNAKGVEYRIPSKSTDNDPLSTDPKETEKPNRLLIYEKPVRECVRDWEELCKKGSIRMDLAERAAGQRAHMFQAAQMKEIWLKLKGLAAAGTLVAPEGAKDVQKRSYTEAFGSGSFESFSL